MAMNFFKKLFSKKKRNSIGMTPEEAYVNDTQNEQADAESWNAEPTPNPFDVPGAGEKREAQVGQAQDAREGQADVNVEFSPPKCDTQPEAQSANAQDTQAQPDAPSGVQPDMPCAPDAPSVPGDTPPARDEAGPDEAAAVGGGEADTDASGARGTEADDARDKTDAPAAQQTSPAAVNAVIGSNLTYGDDAPFGENAPLYKGAASDADVSDMLDAIRAPRQPLRELWLYACLDNPRASKSLLRPRLISSFGALSEDENGFAGRLPSGARVRVQLKTDAAFVREQTGYLKTQYQKASFADKDIQSAALMQIELFNTIITYSLASPYADGDPEATRAAAFGVARHLRAFLLTETAELYRWDEKLLIAPDGRTEFSAFLPTGNPSSSAGARLSGDDEARISRSLELMRKHALTNLTPTPVQTCEADARLRSPSEIVARMAAVFACTLQAQAYSTPGETGALAAWSRNAISRMDAQYGVNHHFTRKEAQYCLKPSSAQHESYLNGFEAVATLLWALGLLGLSWPGERANQNAIMRVVRDADTDMLLRIAKPRSLTDVLDMHDLTYRLHRACLHAGFDGKPLKGLDPDVVYERHYALNWLVATDGITDWDMVVPKT